MGRKIDVKKIFSKRLKTLREEKQLTQDALAEKLGISRGSISFYENGTRTPDIEVFCRIASFFNVSLNYLMGLANAGKPENEEIGEQTGLSDKAVTMLAGTRGGMLPEFINAVLEHSKVDLLAPIFLKLMKTLD